MGRWTPIFLLAFAAAAQTPDAMQRLERRWDSLTPEAQPGMAAPGPYRAPVPKPAPGSAFAKKPLQTPTARASGPTTIVRLDLAAPAKCAIPLLAARIAPGFQDKMSITPPAAGAASMQYVQPSAPVCETVPKTAP